MSISASTIKTEVARRLGRNSSDINDYELRAALQFITMKLPALGLTCTVSTVAGQPSYDLRLMPAQFKRLEALSIDNGDNEETFGKIANFDVYQDLVIGETSTDYDEPYQYIIWNDLLYVFPTPDAVYTMRLFALVYERDVDSISLPDAYDELLISRTCYEVLKNKGMARSDEALGHLASAKELIDEFNNISNEKIPVTHVQYNDI